MASPFRLFRKYQKPLLVVAGVVLIFVFVLSDSLTSYLRSSSAGASGKGGRRPNDIAVRWDGGSLTNVELSQLVTRRLVVNGFLREVEGRGYATAAAAGSEPPPLRVTRLLGPERPQQGVEQHLVQTRVVSDAARAAGMNVSDEHIVHYLEELGRGYLTIDDIRAILSRLSVGGRRANMDLIFDALREEILARNFLLSYTYAFDTILPEQRWVDWLHANDRVVVEAAAVDTDSFVVDAPEPSEAELTTFYDQYKDREPQPDRLGDMELPSPLPGFKVPRKIELQYLRAGYDQFLTKAEEQVTDEQVQNYYDEHKDPYFIRAGSPLTNDHEQDGAAKGDAGGKAPASNSGDAKPTSGTPDKTAPAAGDHTSIEKTSPPNAVQLTAFEDEKPTGADAAPSASTESSETPKEYQSLDEVRDEIRRQIALQQVTDQLEQLMEKVAGELDAVYSAYLGASLDAEAAKSAPPPLPPELADLSAVAQKHGLEYEKTAPVSDRELLATPIGLSRKSEDERISFESRMPLVLIAFNKDTELYQPIATVDIDGNRYVAMKTSDLPARVPELSEIRQDVIRAWKQRKAADLALAHAKELAKKAENSGTSLAELFVDDKSISVTKTDPFALLTIGSISPQDQQVQSFRLSEPEGITAAGPEFMQKVFELGDGDVGAVLNHDHSVAYVVRLVEHEKTPAELHQDFLSEADKWYGLRATALSRIQGAQNVLQSEVIDAAKVDWLRDPDKLASEQE